MVLFSHKKIAYLIVILQMAITPLALCEQANPFFMISIPKSGTHLVLKLMSLMLGQEDRWIHPYFTDVDSFVFEDHPPIKSISNQHVEDVMNMLYEAHITPFTHTNFSVPLLEFKKKHPEYVSILVIRDLRDVLVSWAIFREPTFNVWLGPSTIKQRLHFILNNCEQDKGFARFVMRSFLWLGDKNLFVLRFEDIIGSRGKGCDELQKQTIINLANKLNVSMDAQKLDYITSNLFGQDASSGKFSTFKSGQIGSYKEHFDEEITELFNQKFGLYQLLLGYPLD